jgi:hypothetical protein
MRLGAFGASRPPSLYDDIYSSCLLWCGRELAPPSTVIIRLNLILLTLPWLQKPAARIGAEKKKAENKKAIQKSDRRRLE